MKQRKGAIKVAGVKGEQTGVLQREGPSLFSSQTHTHTYIEMQTASWWHASLNLADTHRTYACVHTPTTAKTHTPRNYRENSCSLTSRCCRDDWGEEKCRSKESREREERGGKDGGAAVYLLEDLLVACCLLNRVWTKSPLRITLRGNLSQIPLDLDGTYPVLLKKKKKKQLFCLSWFLKGFDTDVFHSAQTELSMLARLEIKIYTSKLALGKIISALRQQQVSFY